MASVFNFFKKNWLYILLAALASSLVVVSLVFKKQEGPTPNPTPTPIAWNNITPGKSNLQDTLQVLGQPISRKTDEDGQILEYSSRSNTRYNQVKLEQNTVKLIKEPVVGNEITLSQFTQQFGEPETLLYEDQHASAGFALNVFASHGVAILAQPDTGIALEVWYFEPMSLETFKSTLGKNLSTQPPGAL